MGEIVRFHGESRLDLPVATVLDQAAERELDGAVIIGRTSEGNLYFHSSIADGADVLWLMELAKKALLGDVLD